MTLSLLGALFGLTIAGAILLWSSWLLARRPLRLVDRIGPFVGIPGHTRVVRAGIDLPRAGGSKARRPRMPGRSRRAPAAVGALIGAMLAALLTLDDPNPPAWIALGTVGAVAGAWVADARARLHARRRERVIESHAPVLADLLALAVSAGAGVVPALDRSASQLTGPLAECVDQAVRRIRSGEPVEGALDGLGSQAPAVRRLVDAMLVALDRGTPLADVLRAQAHDARAEERQRLMESAGRRDVAMLVPIVFLVLPSVVLIAAFPAIRALEVVVP
jgi:tight adherence protein C